MRTALIIGSFSANKIKELAEGFSALITSTELTDKKIYLIREIICQEKNDYIEIFVKENIDRDLVIDLVLSLVQDKFIKVNLI